MRSQNRLTGGLERFRPPDFRIYIVYFQCVMSPKNAYSPRGYPKGVCGLHRFWGKMPSGIREESGSSGAAFLAMPRLLLRFFLLRRLSGHLQVVLHLEDSGNAVGAQKSDILVRLGVHRAIEFHVAVLHRDADWLGG